jgi:hypothetical protein
MNDQWPFPNLQSNHTYQHPVAQCLLALQSCPRTSSANAQSSMLSVSKYFPDIRNTQLVLSLSGNEGVKDLIPSSEANKLV